MSNTKEVHSKPRLHVSLSTCYLEYGRRVAWLHRRRRRRAYAPTSNTASHDNHEKINSWVSFCFPYMGCLWGSALIFSETFCRITRFRNIAHPRNFGTLSIYYSSTLFQFLDSTYWMVSDFIFHLRDNQAYLRDVKTTNKRNKEKKKKCAGAAFFASSQTLASYFSQDNIEVENFFSSSTSILQVGWVSSKLSGSWRMNLPWTHRFPSVRHLGNEN